ncbi:MAG: cellulase family glycosylhydrolase, partial [Spirochaetota bacterium]
AALLDPLQKWGVNVIRFLFTWEAYEPVKGEYNQEYLAYYKNVIKWAHERGIYVIVDFHQDAFSRYTVHGCGEGFPEWAVPPMVIKGTPSNDSSCKIWGAEMIWDAPMHLSWHHFYANTYGVRDRYLLMVGSVSAALGDTPGVLGYDMLNEPWGNEITEIAALYEDAAKVIRANDPDSVLFASPHALISSGNSSELPAMSFDNYVYSPHYYDGMIITLNWWWGTSPASKLNQNKKKGDAFGVPTFWGEFGINPTAKGGTDYMDLFYAWMDKYGASGTQWCYTPGWTPEKYDGHNDENLSIVDDTGTLRANWRIRPYPQRLAGTPGTFEVTFKDSGALKMYLKYTHDPRKGDTKIYLPKELLFGTAGFNVSATADLSYSFDSDGLYLIC